MKKSIKISVAIILATITASLFYAAHGHITGFDACIFIALIAIGFMLAQSESISSEDQEEVNKVLNEIEESVHRMKKQIEDQHSKHEEWKKSRAANAKTAHFVKSANCEALLKDI